MGVADLLADHYVTPADYLVGEERSDRKHEYLAGVVYAMAGAGEAHNVIGANLHGSLWQQLRNRRCRSLAADYKVRIQTRAAEFYYYPDVMIDCAEFKADSQYAEEPRVIFEVLSRDTERIDRHEKWSHYQTLPSLDVYVLVDQFKLAVTAYRRAAGEWTQELLIRPEAVLDLPTVDCSLPLAVIYERTQLLRERD